MYAPTLRVVVAAMALVLPVLAACGSDDNELCKARDDVRRSFERLQAVNVIEQGTNALRPAVDQLRKDLTRLGEEAKDAYGPQVTALRTALESLGTSIRGTEGQPLTDRIRQSADALQQVRTAAEQLFESVSKECP
jgi:small-conductance mechanosensitive channel